MSDDDAAWRASVNRQLRELAVTPRFQPAAIASGAANFEITAYGQNNWRSDAGGATPAVTLRTGSSVGIFAQWRPLYVGNGGTSTGVNDFRSASVVMGIQIDETPPHLWPLPPMRSQYSLSLVDTGEFFQLPLAFSVFRSDLTPGTHTFSMRFFAFDTAPAKTLNPLMTDTVLAVLPIETV